LRELLKIANLPHSLNGSAVSTGHIPTLALEAARQWTAQFNPRTVVASDFEQLYAAALNHS
jgi:alcohol dehydrogenase